MNKYFLASFVIKDKKYLNPYLYERKKIYFTAASQQDVEDYIKANHIDSSGAYDYTISECKAEDLKGHWPTDGFYCVVRPLNDVIGTIDITEREFLVDWEVREHDGEYAKVLRRENFIVKCNDGTKAGKIADNYAHSRRYAYYDDYTFYTITDIVDEIERVKKSGNFITI